LRDRAVHAGKGQEFLSALRMMDERLRMDPIGFGDPWYNLPAGKLRVFVRVFPPLVMGYAVHHAQPLVFVRGIRPFPVDAF
jgi:hypothetical protein